MLLLSGDVRDGTVPVRYHGDPVRAGYHAGGGARGHLLLHHPQMGETPLRKGTKLEQVN